MRILKALLAAALLLLIPMSGSAASATLADVSVSMTVSPQPVIIYWNLTYKIVVQNHGPGVATNVKLLDSYGSDANYVWAATSEGSCVHKVGGEVSCALGNMWSGELVYVTVILKNWGGDGGGNHVQVSSITPDPKKGNNTATTNTKIIAGPPPPGGTPTGGPSHTPSPSVRPSRSSSSSATASPTATESTSATPGASAAVTSSSNSGIWIVVAIVVLAAAGTAGFLLWRRRR